MVRVLHRQLGAENPDAVAKLVQQPGVLGHLLRVLALLEDVVECLVQIFVAFVKLLPICIQLGVSVVVFLFQRHDALADVHPLLVVATGPNVGLRRVGGSAVVGLHKVAQLHRATIVEHVRPGQLPHAPELYSVGLVVLLHARRALFRVRLDVRRQLPTAPGAVVNNGAGHRIRRGDGPVTPRRGFVFFVLVVLRAQQVKSELFGRLVKLIVDRG